jgi:hypothetical protein
MRNHAFLAAAAAVALLWAGPARATLVPEVGFETLVAESEAIVHGTVVRSWAAWDDQRAAIWTHYEIRVSDWLKGSRATSIQISEPGGSLDGMHTQIIGAPRYAVGEEVVVFADKTPIGYLRTCGWSQGKFLVSSQSDAARKIVAPVSSGARIVNADRQLETPLSSFRAAQLDGFMSRIRREVAAGSQR